MSAKAKRSVSHKIVADHKPAPVEVSEAVVPPPEPVVPQVDMDAEVDIPQTDAEIAEEKSQISGNKRVFAMGVVGGLAIALTSFAVYGYYLMSVGKVSTAAPSPKPTVIAATPTPAFNRAQITFEVLNGSGVSGAAAKAAEKLTGLGYTVSKTGNGKLTAKNQLFVSAEIKDNKALLTDMESLFGITQVSDTLTGTATARLIVGKDK